MSIENIRRYNYIYKCIKNDIDTLDFLKQSLKEAGGKYYITGLSSYVPRRLYNKLRNEKIVNAKGQLSKAPLSIRQLFREKRDVYVYHSVCVWIVDREKLTFLINNKMDMLVIIEF